MPETGESLNLAVEVGVGPEKRNLLAPAKTKEFFAKSCSQLAKGLKPEHGVVPLPPFLFQAGWNSREDIRVLSEEDFNILSGFRGNILSALEAMRKHSEETVDFNPLENPRDGYRWKIEEEGEEGIVTLGQLVVAHKMAVEAMLDQEGVAKEAVEQAGDTLELLTQRIDVFNSEGKKISYREYDEQLYNRAIRLYNETAEEKKVTNRSEFEELKPVERYLALVKAEKELNPQFILAHAPEAPAEAAAQEVEAETPEEKERKDFELGSKIFLLKEGAGEEIMPLVRELRSGELTEEEFKNKFQELEEMIKSLKKENPSDKDLLEQLSTARIVYKRIIGKEDLPEGLSLDEMKKKYLEFVLDMTSEQKKNLKSIWETLKEKKPSEQTMLILFMLLMGLGEIAKSMQQEAAQTQ